MKNIFIYNPTSEMAIANGTNSYMPPKNLLKFERDLAFIPSFFAKEEDCIIVEDIPDNLFLDQWHHLGLPKLNYIKPSEINSSLQYNSLCPWSWNQTVHHKFKNILSAGSDEFKTSPNYIWNIDHKHFFSRDTANRVQKIISDSFSTSHVKISTPAINITSINQFSDWLIKTPVAIIKMPWSSSGRGIHVIDEENNKKVNLDWVKGAIKQQGFVTAEPLLNKVFDFSFQLDIKRNGDIELLGYSFFINDNKGHFIGGNINWPHQDDVISRFLSNETLDQAALTLIEALKKVNPHQYYVGPIGVDSIVYMDDEKQFKIHPCLDINWRYNMGLININLPKYVHEDSKGKWLVGSFQPGEWDSFIAKNQQEKPLILKDNKIKSGFINLTPQNKNARFGVWMEIFKQ